MDPVCWIYRTSRTNIAAWIIWWRVRRRWRWPRCACLGRSETMKRREFNARLAGAAAGAAFSSLQASETNGAGGITDVPGIKVGHFTESRKPTGCTVLIFEKGATAGVDVRGSAPGTRDTDLLNPVNSAQQVQAILLSGGSAFGLDAATGVV